MPANRAIQKKDQGAPLTSKGGKSPKGKKPTPAELRALEEEEDDQEEQQTQPQEEQEEEQSDAEDTEQYSAKRAKKIRKQEKRERKQLRKKFKKDKALNAIYGDRKFLQNVMKQQQAVLREHPLLPGSVKNLVRMRLTDDAEKQIRKFEPDFPLEEARAISHERTEALAQFRRQQSKRFEKWLYGAPVQWNIVRDPENNDVIISKTKIMLPSFLRMIEKDLAETIKQQKARYKAEYEAFKSKQPEDTYKPKVAEYRKRLEADGLQYIARAGEEVVHLVFADSMKLKKWETASKKKVTLRMQELMGAIDVNPTFQLVTGPFIKEQEAIHDKYMVHKAAYQQYANQQKRLESAETRVAEREEEVQEKEEKLQALEKNLARKQKRAQKEEEAAEAEEEQENSVNTKQQQQPQQSKGKRKAVEQEEEETSSAPAPKPKRVKAAAAAAAAAH